MDERQTVNHEKIPIYGAICQLASASKPVTTLYRNISAYFGFEIWLVKKSPIRVNQPAPWSKVWMKLVSVKAY